MNPATALLLVCIVSGALEAAGQVQDSIQPRTRAERTEYKETSTHADVLEFCRALTNQAPAVRLISFGKSEQGRELPLLVLAEPPLSAPDELGGKPVILVLGAIHGGEVCGKEALLMLARQWGMNGSELLREFVILVAPLYNADGNEQISTDHRRNQNGPQGGVGRRENALRLDLNRDFTKLEAPETRALVKLIRDWDPVILIDTHATNGSKHRYALTYDGPRHPAGDPSVAQYARETFLPEITRRVRDKAGLETFFYGNFEHNESRWVTYPSQARYGIHYVGLRHRLGILAEAYAYAPFQERVEATVAFVRECAHTALAQRKEILQLVRAARDRATQPKEGERLALQARLAPFPDKVAVLGFDSGAQERPESKDVEFWGRSDVVREVALPVAYVIPRGHPAVVTNLLRHGIRVEELRETVELDLERYEVESVTRQDQVYQGHRLAEWTVRSRSQRQRIEAGTWIVRSAQPLGRLAAVLLEPESEDGLAAWSFFDDVKPGEEFPIARLLDPASLLTVPMPAVAEERRWNRRVTFDALHGTNKVDFNGSPTRIERWLPDDSKYLQVREGRLQQVDPTIGRPENLFDPDKVRAALEQLPELTADASAISKRSSFQMDPKLQGALFEHDNDLYYFRFDTTAVRRLTRTPDAEELAEFSPDGRWVSFVRQGNLYVVGLSNELERALTTDGGGDILNGKAGWVYFEEVYNRKWKAYWWSPDSSRIAFLRFDERALPLFHALDSIPLHGRLVTMRHPRAGDPNPDVRLGVVTAAGGTPRWANLEGYADFLITRVGWLPQGAQLFCYVQDRAQRWLDFLSWDPRKAEMERLFREISSAWVDDPGDPLFLDEGDLVFTSERTDWRHLYRFYRQTKQWTALTQGDWEVRRVLGLDPETKQIYFTASKDSPLAENLYRCPAAGGEVTRITLEPGHHTVSLSTTFKYVVDQWSSFSTPPRVQLLNSDGALVRLLDSNPVHALEEFQFGQSELVQVPAQDGFLFEGVLTRPPDFAAGRRYPAWFMTYGGPQASSVRNAWGSAQDQLLAAMGLVVFRMDPRSASGKGSWALKSIYRQLGVQELADITEGIEWLKAKPYVDGSRIGMSGHSYGGFLTAYAMTHSRLFAAGIAGAPVTDWRYYDSIYTERYMDTPQNNPDGYAKTSVVKAAQDLHGRLLLLHGMMDDNVHLQNTTALIQALQKAKKDFEVMFYPEMLHGLQGEHYQRLLVDFIRRSLKLEPLD